MPIAAVPNYLKRTAEGGLDEQFFLSSPPGHRFGLYFPVWGWDGERHCPTWSLEDRVERLNNKGQRTGWKPESNKSFAGFLAAGCKPRDDAQIRRAWQTRGPDPGPNEWKKAIDSLRARQSSLFENLASRLPSLQVHGEALSPFTTGLGNEHPLENGFAFLNPYGLPYLPGSGVKGVLRRAAQELAGGEWGDARGWSKDEHYQVTIDGKAVRLSMFDVLFGREPPPGDSDAVRGALTFWDVIPEIKGDSLMVEVMTPHQSHYYQRRREPKSGNSDSPHDSGQPNPIFFLTVP
ncbi:MAG: type III-B CRISPR module RAMP protein Cmr6, partial [Casimicrobiaceae bacterium]|nr:type III-B CRISPR module RAMP protein Cmr6 [Casimicrobiaceae bacterium]